MNKRMLVAILVIASACASLPRKDPATVANVIDAFHTAASKADETAYFDLLAPDAVFFGTDASERWDKQQFREFAHPFFSQGKGWTFTPRDRHIYFSADGRTAWFDEMLDSASYGVCRGTGVLQRIDGSWKIEQYHLTIPIPNALAKEFVGRIRESSKP